MTPKLHHASCISLQGMGLLIQGASGSGKSGLALNLIAMGCDLVSDDQTYLELHEESVLATAPSTIVGKIEARGVGILACPTVPSTLIKAIVDMDQIETERLPPYRTTTLLDQSLPVFHKVVAPHFSAALLLYLKGARLA